MYIYVWLVFTFSDFSLYTLIGPVSVCFSVLPSSHGADSTATATTAGPHLRAGLECPRDRHLLGQPLLCLHGRLLLTRGG